jgi:hypothetical protein
MVLLVDLHKTYGRHLSKTRKALASTLTGRSNTRHQSRKNYSFFSSYNYLVEPYEAAIQNANEDDIAKPL